MTRTIDDVRRVFVGRGVRALVDGLVSVVLAQYLIELGFSPFRVGAIVTGTLIGSAALTLGVGLAGGRRSSRRLLLAASALMIATGVGFAFVTPFWGIFLVAVVGTLNPTSGDVSVFLPTEQALLAAQVGAVDRPRTYATLQPRRRRRGRGRRADLGVSRAARATRSAGAWTRRSGCRSALYAVAGA